MKDNTDYEKLIDKDKYQVFLFRCSAHFPFNFADHIWFVINKKGEISRWEILYKKDYRSESHWGHLYKNYNQTFEGLNLFNFYPGYRSKSKLLNMIEGADGSTAEKMANFIENSPKSYPYSNNADKVLPKPEATTPRKLLK
jgi:hypothetical protein